MWLLCHIQHPQLRELTRISSSGGGVTENKEPFLESRFVRKLWYVRIGKRKRKYKKEMRILQLLLPAAARFWYWLFLIPLVSFFQFLYNSVEQPILYFCLKNNKIWYHGPTNGWFVVNSRHTDSSRATMWKDENCPQGDTVCHWLNVHHVGKDFLLMEILMGLRYGSVMPESHEVPPRGMNLEKDRCETRREVSVWSRQKWECRTRTVVKVLSANTGAVLGTKSGQRAFHSVYEDHRHA